MKNEVVFFFSFPGFKIQNHILQLLQQVLTYNSAYNPYLQRTKPI